MPIWWYRAIWVTLILCGMCVSDMSLCSALVKGPNLQRPISARLKKVCDWLKLFCDSVDHLHGDKKIPSQSIVFLNTNFLYNGKESRVEIESQISYDTSNHRSTNLIRKTEGND